MDEGEALGVDEVEAIGMDGDETAGADEGEAVDADGCRPRDCKKDLNIEDFKRSWKCSDRSNAQLEEALIVDAEDTESVKEAKPAEDADAMEAREDDADTGS